MKPETIKLYLEIITAVITITSIPMAIFLYVQEKNKARREREYGTYNALDDKYISFLQLCLQYPELNVYYPDYDTERELTTDQKKQQKILYDILISILERAFLMYRDQSSSVKKTQWQGWNHYMEDWMRHKNFRAQWKELGEQWDTDFVLHMQKIHAAIVKKEKSSDGKPKAKHIPKNPPK